MTGNGACRGNLDTAGGTIRPRQNTKVKFEGFLAIVIGDPVDSHGDCDGPVMITGSSKFKINGIGVCRRGDTTSCGDVATGSTKILIS